MAQGTGNATTCLSETSQDLVDQNMSSYEAQGTGNTAAGLSEASQKLYDQNIATRLCVVQTRFREARLDGVGKWTEE